MYSFIILSRERIDVKPPYLIDAPKGIKASFAILKCCKPKGIPTIVMHRRRPNIADSMARGIPATNNQMIFKSKEPAPPPYTTSFPKGKKHRPANLKHCVPMGIPIMVIQNNTPTRSQLNPLINPPHINHIILPKHPIIRLLL